MVKILYAALILKHKAVVVIVRYLIKPLVAHNSVTCNVVYLPPTIFIRFTVWVLRANNLNVVVLVSRKNCRVSIS